MAAIDPLQRVLVPVRECPAGHVLGAADLGWLEVEADLLDHDGFVLGAEALGRTVRERLLPYEILRQERIGHGARGGLLEALGGMLGLTRGRSEPPSPEPPSPEVLASLAELRPPSPGAGGTVPVVMVGRDLPAGTVLSLRDIFLMPGVASERLTPGHFYNPVEIVGRVLAEPVYEHEVLRPERLAPR